MYIVKVEDAPEGVATITLNSEEQETIHAALDLISAYSGNTADNAKRILAEWAFLSNPDKAEG